MQNHPKPHKINFGQIGEVSIGYISINELEKNIPFHVKRLFWTYYTPESVIRGKHAHYETEQVLIAVAGRIIVKLENANGDIKEFVLDTPKEGVYIPPNYWHTMKYSHNAVQLVLASTEYKEEDYIRDYNKFKEVYGS